MLPTYPDTVFGVAVYSETLATDV